MYQRWLFSCCFFNWHLPPQSLSEINFLHVNVTYTDHLALQCQEIKSNLNLSRCSYQQLGPLQDAAYTQHMWQDMRKGTISHIFWIFILKCLQLGKYNSYRLHFWCEDSHIILLHSQDIMCHAHFRFGGASMRVDQVQKSPFCASLWQFTARCRRLTLASNVGSVK